MQIPGQEWFPLLKGVPPPAEPSEARRNALRAAKRREKFLNKEKNKKEIKKTQRALAR